MASIIAEFSVPFYQYLSSTGVLSEDTPHQFIEKERLLCVYRLMVLARVFDARAIALQRTGQLGTYPSLRGQEAVFAGMGQVMEQGDAYVPYYRDVGALIQRGASLTDILLYWGGDERGNRFAGPALFPYCVPIGSQLLHAAGIAAAFEMRDEKRAVLAVCGDGATSEGDFHEALNVAGVWSLPLVIVINNNQWAISMPRTAQTAAKTLAQKAIAAGVDGEQVDGNDVIAVMARVSAALSTARTRHQPTLIEMTCYRQGDHTTADSASRYEPAGMREAAWQNEPVERLKRFLESRNMLDEGQAREMEASCVAEVDAAVTASQALAPEPLSALFDFLYHTIPETLAVQRDGFSAAGESGHA